MAWANTVLLLSEKYRAAHPAKAGIIPLQETGELSSTGRGQCGFFLSCGRQSPPPRPRPASLGPRPQERAESVDGLSVPHLGPVAPAFYGQVRGGGWARAWGWGGGVEQGKGGNFYYLGNCFRNAINSDYWPQIFT